MLARYTHTKCTDKRSTLANHILNAFRITFAGLQTAIGLRPLAWQKFRQLKSLPNSARVRGIWGPPKMRSRQHSYRKPGHVAYHNLRERFGTSKQVHIAFPNERRTEKEIRILVNNSRMRDELDVRSLDGFIAVSPRNVLYMARIQRQDRAYAVISRDAPDEPIIVLPASEMDVTVEFFPSLKEIIGYDIFFIRRFTKRSTSTRRSSFSKKSP